MSLQMASNPPPRLHPPWSPAGAPARQPEGPTDEAVLVGEGGACKPFYDWILDLWRLVLVQMRPAP
eukprot:660638-Pyramimonas_sp.AAC.1